MCSISSHEHWMKGRNISQSPTFPLSVYSVPEHGPSVSMTSSPSKKISHKNSLKRVFAIMRNLEKHTQFENFKAFLKENYLILRNITKRHTAQWRNTFRFMVQYSSGLPDNLYRTVILKDIFERQFQREGER